MTDPGLREMRPGDVEAVARLAGELGYPTAAADIAARRDGLAGRDDVALLVATDDADEAIGWIHVERRNTLVAEPAAQVMALVVGNGHRGTGVGRLLLAAAENWAAERDCHVLLVATRVTRRDAHRFYRREGYRLNKTSHIFEKPLP